MQSMLYLLPVFYDWKLSWIRYQVMRDLINELFNVHYFFKSFWDLVPGAPNEPNEPKAVEKAFFSTLWCLKFVQSDVFVR